MTKIQTKNTRSLGGLGKAVTFGALSLSASMIPLSHALALDDNALPTGGTVVGGSATIDYSTPNTVNVYQGSDRAVIDWSTFNIGSNSTAQFYQPSSNSIVVNRVTGTNQDPSQIMGSLKANGTVFVLDRNGVIFGSNSQVDVGSIVVSTGNIDDNAFMSGSNVITLDNINPNSSIVNNGTITVAEAGLAAFVAPTLVNNGLIQAKMGRVALASGSKATIDLYGDDLVELATDIPLNDAKIENNGTISAQGGTVLITAEAAKNIVDSVINMTGLVDVSSVSEKGGKIILEGANTEVSGTLDASGKTGGGTIHVGGGYQGGGKTRHADTGTITSTAKIKANTSGDNGDGGEIVIWSDDKTFMAGSLEAKGGSESGKGGSIETSSKGELGIEGYVDAGAGGEWLLDPSNVIIDGSVGNNIPGTGGTTNAATDSYTINANSIQTALNNGNNVTITTTNAGGTQTGTITVDSNVFINKTAGGNATLTLKSNSGMDLNGTIESTGAGNKLNVTVWTDFDGSGNDGALTMGGTLKTNGGNINLTGGADDGANGRTAGDGLGDGGLYSGTLLWGATLQAQGGNIAADGWTAATNGLYLGGGTNVSTTGTGNITLSGRSLAGTGDYSGGLVIDGSTISAQDGTITLTGSNVSTSAGGEGIHFVNGSQITTTGTTGGNIVMTGTRTNSNNWYGVGIQSESGGATISSAKGDITLNGNSGAVNSWNGAYGMQFTDMTIKSATGNIVFNGNATTGAPTDFVVAGTTTIGDATSTGNITFNNDTMDLTGLNVLTKGNIVVKPRTASTSIGLGDSSTGTLNLTAAELAMFNGTGNLIIGDSTAGTGDVDLNNWDLSSKTFNVQLYANDIDLGGLTLGTKDFTAYAMDNSTIDLGNLIVNIAAITKSVAGSSNLTLRADTNISVFSSITASTGSLNVVLNSDRDADSNAGLITIGGSAITTNGGYFVAGGGGGTLWGTDGIKGTADDATSTGADKVAAFGTTGSGVNLSGTASIDAGAGDIIINGHGSTTSTADSNHGIYIGGTIQNSGAGTITLNGTGGGTGTSSTNSGIYFDAAVTSGSGGMNITGVGGGAGSGSSNYGLTINKALSSANGVINLTGTGGNGTGGSRGLRMTGGSINAGSAAINISATYGTGGTAEDANLSAGTIGGVGQSGDINLNLNSIGNTGTTFTTTGGIRIKPRTASTSIGLGGGLGTLNLDDSELGYFNAGTLTIGDSVNGTGDIDLDSWDLTNTSYGVALYGNDIDIGGLTLKGRSFTATAKDNGSVDLGTITVSAPITKSLNITTSLFLLADKDIVFNSGSNITASLGSLNVVLNADRDADNDGAISLSSSNITTNGGYLVMGGGSGTLWGTDGVKGTADDATSTGADNVAARGNSIYNVGVNIVGSTINTGAGDIYTKGTGWAGSTSNTATAHASGILLDSSSITTGAGAVNMTGAGGGTGAAGFNMGIWLSNTSSVVTSGGNITMKGVGGNGTGGTNYGVILSSVTSNIIKSTSGTIDITGTTGAASTIGIASTNTSSTAGILSDGSSAINLTAPSGSITLATTTGGASATGNITIKTDSIALQNNLVRTAGSIFIKPYTASTSIGLGGGSGTLNLDDTELGLLTAGTLIIGDSAAGTGDIDLDSWDLSAKTHNVELYGNDIDLGGLTLGTGNFLAYAMDNAAVDLGTLTVSAATTKSVAGTSLLNLRADKDVVFTSGANVTASGSGILNMALNADRDADLDGAISIDTSNITTNGGYAVLGGGAGALGGTDGILGNGDGTGADDVMAWGNSAYFNGINIASSAISTGAGNIYANGHGYNNSGSSNHMGVYIAGAGSGLTTTSGDINVTGTAGLAAANMTGLFIQGSNAKIQTATGNINIKAANVATTVASTQAINMDAGKIISTGSGSSIGSINIDATNYQTTGSGVGLVMGYTAAISSKDANINITTHAGTATSASTVSGSNSTPIIEATGAGNIVIETKSGGSSNGINFFNDNGTQRIGNTTMTGNITLITDGIDTIDTGDSIVTQGILTIKPETASTSIGLGGGSGTLNLDDTSLSHLTASKLIIGDSLSGTGDINVTTWDLSGNTFGVELYGNDINLGGLTLGTGDFTAYAMDNAAVDPGTLTVSAATTKSVAGTSSFTLRADKDIVFTTGANITASGSGILNTVLNADRDADQDGAISITSSAITTNGGYFVGGGGSGNLGGTDGILGNGDGTGADDVAAFGNSTHLNGFGITDKAIKTGAGNIYITGSSALSSGFSMVSDGDIVTTSGKINIKGYHTGSVSGTHAVTIGTSLSSDTGAISIYGNTNAGGGAAGIQIRSTGGVTSTGSSTIGLTAIGTGSSNLYITSNNIIGGAQASGDITINTDSITFDSASANIQTSGTIFLKPRTSTASIGLGGGSGTLNLTDAELASINAGTKLIIGDSVSGTGDIDLDSWDLSAKTYNVELYGNDIDLGGLTLGTGNFTANAKDNASVDLGTITVSAPITKSIAGSSTLMLRADKDIAFNSGSNITATTGLLNLVLNADRDTDLDGAISLTSSNISTNGGYVVMGGGSGTLWGTDGIKGTTDDATSTGADVSYAYGNSSYAQGIALANSNITAAGGDIILNGQGVGSTAAAHGVYMSGTSALSTTGIGGVRIKGHAGDLGNNQYGIVVRSISAGSGGISMDGNRGSGSASARYAISINNDLITTGGVINLTSDSGGTAFGADVTVNSNNADININGSYSGSSAGTRSVVLNAGTGTIKTNTASGTAFTFKNLTMIADDLILGGAVTTTQSLTLKPFTPTQTIGLGGGTGGFNLNDTELGYLNPGTVLTIGDTSSVGDVNIDTWDLSSKSYDVQIFGSDMNLAGITMGSGDVTLYAKGGGIQVSAASTSNASGDLNLLSAYDILIDSAITNSGSGQINLFAGWDATSAITTPALFNRDDVDLALTARDITFGTNGRISSGGTGTAVLIATTNDFINNSSSGANALQTSSGRYLVYVNNPTDTVKGGLTAKNWYNMDYNSNPESDITGTDSRFVFQYQPTLTLTADDITTTDPSTAVYTYSDSGLVTGDLLADALSGTGSFTLSALSGGTRSIIFGAGSLTSPNGYALVFTNGTMTISGGTPPPPPPPSPPTSTPPTPVLDNAVLNHTSNITKVSVIESSDSSATPTDTKSDTSNAAIKGQSVDCLASDNAGCVVN